MNVLVDNWAWFDKAELSPATVSDLKSMLTIVPRRVGNYPGDPPAPIPLYQDEKDNFGVPRQFFMQRRKLTHAVEVRTTHGAVESYPGPLTFAGSLRPEQENAVSSVVSTLRAGGLGGLIQAVPGWGKTVAACALMQRMGVPTLVVVHKDFLLNQWLERITQFLPDAKVGLIQQDTCEFEGRHIAIAMVHSLAARDYGAAFRAWPGLVITDECHRIGAATWAPVPSMFKAAWRIGFTATPRRKDGAENVFYWQLGPVLYRSKERRMKPKVFPLETGFKLVQTQNLNPALISKTLLLRFLCKNERRNDKIVEVLLTALRKGRKILVLSERLNHLRLLETKLQTAWGTGDQPLTTGFYVGGMTEDSLAVSKEARCIFATVQFAAEGLDIPALDTLVLTTPMSDVEQAAGRVLRPFEGKKEPFIIDLRDAAVPYCAKAATSRDRYYSTVV